jgi:hypothetical protein
VRPAPSSVSNGSTDKKVARADVISELGIFGYPLFGGGGRGGAQGGVACKDSRHGDGFLVLDSVLLSCSHGMRRIRFMKG